VLDLGAIAGLLVAGTFAERVGPRTAGIVGFAAGAVFRALLSVGLPIAGSYVMVFLTGCFVFSAQVLVYAFTSANHPPQVRATALGWAAGVGRVGAITGPVIGGALLSAGYAFPRVSTSSPSSAPWRWRSPGSGRTAPPRSDD
jgi:MFS family permease